MPWQCAGRKLRHAATINVRARAGPESTSHIPGPPPPAPSPPSRSKAQAPAAHKRSQQQQQQPQPLAGELSQGLLGPEDSLTAFLFGQQQAEREPPGVSPIPAARPATQAGAVQLQGSPVPRSYRASVDGRLEGSPGEAGGGGGGGGESPYRAALLRGAAPAPAGSGRSSRLYQPSSMFSPGKVAAAAGPAVSRQQGSSHATSRNPPSPPRSPKLASGGGWAPQRPLAVPPPLQSMHRPQTQQDAGSGARPPTQQGSPGGGGGGSSSGGLYKLAGAVSCSPKGLGSVPELAGLSSPRLANRQNPTRFGLQRWVPLGPLVARPRAD